MRIVQMTFFLIVICIMMNCEKSVLSQQDEVVMTDLTGAYLGQELPGIIPELFAPEIFEEELHAPPIFLHDGSEVYWTYMEYGDPHIYWMKMEGNYWTAPALAPFCRGDITDFPFLTPDGEKLYFSTSNAPEYQGQICVVERLENNEWGTPGILSEEINSTDPFGPVSVSTNQNLYFGARPGGSPGDIYFSKYSNGGLSTPTILGPEINTEKGREGFPYISPDESYLIFFRTAEGASNADLFVSFKNLDGSWGESIPLSQLNSTYQEFYANVSPDGRFIMYTKGHGFMRPYWVDASIIEELKP